MPPQFVALPATANSLSGEPIVPGSKVLLKSVKTNKYCRVVQAGEDPTQIKCDVTDPAQATPIDYTGTGFAYQVQSWAMLPCWCSGAGRQTMTLVAAAPAGPAVHQPRVLRAPLSGRARHTRHHQPQ